MKKTYIDFLEISESPCSPNKPEEANNNTANAAKIIVDGNEKNCHFKEPYMKHLPKQQQNQIKNHLREK